MLPEEVTHPETVASAKRTKPRVPIHRFLSACALVGSLEFIWIFISTSHAARSFPFHWRFLSEISGVPLWVRAGAEEGAEAPPALDVISSMDDVIGSLDDVISSVDDVTSRITRIP